MNAVYIQRLRAVSGEYTAAQQAVGYIILKWQSQSIYDEIRGLTPKDFQRTNALLERTYFIRLFAEFEGILKDHLATNHPSLYIGDKPKVDWLIAQVKRAEKITIDPDLRKKIEEIRDYRNSIAHLNSKAPVIIKFGDAVSRLNTFLAKLPDPIS